MALHLKITLGKDHQNVSWSKLIYDDRSLKSLADARSVTQARQYFNFLIGHLLLMICILREACPRFDTEKYLQIGH